MASNQSVVPQLKSAVGGGSEKDQQRPRGSDRFHGLCRLDVFIGFHSVYFIIGETGFERMPSQILECADRRIGGLKIKENDAETPVKTANDVLETTK